MSLGLAKKDGVDLRVSVADQGVYSGRRTQHPRDTDPQARPDVSRSLSQSTF